MFPPKLAHTTLSSPLSSATATTTTFHFNRQRATRPPTILPWMAAEATKAPLLNVEQFLSLYQMGCTLGNEQKRRRNVNLHLISQSGIHEWGRRRVAEEQVIIIAPWSSFWRASNRVSEWENERWTKVKVHSCFLGGEAEDEDTWRGIQCIKWGSGSCFLFYFQYSFRLL